VAAQGSRCLRVQWPAQRAVQFGLVEKVEKNDGKAVAEDVGHAMQPRMAAAGGLPERPVAFIFRRVVAGHRRQNGLVGVGAAIAMFDAKREKAQARDIGPMAAIVVRQPQGKTVHQRTAGQRIERPLLWRNAGRRTETPAMTVGTDPSLLPQHFDMIGPRRHRAAWLQHSNIPNSFTHAFPQPHATSRPRSFFRKY
jgi:hypothetical protein